MKTNFFNRNTAPKKPWSPIAPPLVPKAVKTAIIGTLSAAVGVGGALLQYEFSEHNALRQAIKLTQDFDLYTSNPDKLQFNIKSVFDSRFAFAPEEAKKSNEFFIRDAVIHRHDMACGRDSLYMKETQEQGQIYLGCSIQVGTYSDGVHINTYAIGKEFSVTPSERQAAEFKEYQLHFTFPRDFQDRLMAMTDQKRPNALDLARFAIDINVETQGQTREILAGGPELLQKIAKQGGYFERWVLNGSEPSKLLSGMQSLGVLPADESIDITALTGELTKHLEGVDIISASMAERMTMVELGSNLFSKPSIQRLHQVLDHQCSMEVAGTTRDGFSDHNKRCASDLGLQMSPQLASSLISSENINKPGEVSVHGATKRDEVILGSYKGHPVVTSLTKISDDYVAYVRPGAIDGSHWSDAFVAKAFGANSSSDAAAGTFVSRKAIEKIHFGIGYDPKHTPIFVDPEILEGKRVDQYDFETQELIIEKVLEHEIKHILDYKIFVEKGLGTKNLPFEKQQIACDLYAIEVMAKKYEDPRKLIKLRDAISSWKVIDKPDQQHAVTSIIGGTTRMSDMLDVSRTLDALRYNQEVETVLQFLDKKIEAKQIATTPEKKSLSHPGF